MTRRREVMMIDGLQDRAASQVRRRSRGRPRQKEGEVGRDKLIERTRAAMNLRPRIDIQRREIAEIIGVTPALISYYFPDKWSLMEAAAHPVIIDHVANIETVLNASTSTQDKFANLIRTYVNFNMNHGYIIDYYMVAAEKINNLDVILRLDRAHDATIAYFQDGIRDGAFKDIGAEVLQSSLWCICRHLVVSQDDPHGIAGARMARSNTIDVIQKAVFDIFWNGIFQSKAPRRIIEH